MNRVILMGGLTRDPDFIVCARCGAEWEDCKILVDDDY